MVGMDEIKSFLSFVIFVSFFINNFDSFLFGVLCCSSLFGFFVFSCSASPLTVMVWGAAVGSSPMRMIIWFFIDYYDDCL